MTRHADRLDRNRLGVETGPGHTTDVDVPVRLSTPLPAGVSVIVNYTI